MQKCRFLLSIFFICVPLCLCGCGESKSPELYFPLKEGFIKKYRVHEIISYTSSNVTDDYYEAVSIILPNTNIENKSVTPLRSSSTKNKIISTIYLISDASGIYQFAHLTQHPFLGKDGKDIKPSISKPPRYLIKIPVKVGASWNRNEEFTGFKNESFSIIEAIDDKVSVPAGEFNNCLRIKRSEKILPEAGEKNYSEEVHWYAPEVGRIRSIMKISSVSVKENIEHTGFRKITSELLSFEK